VGLKKTSYLRRILDNVIVKVIVGAIPTSLGGLSGLTCYQVDDAPPPERWAITVPVQHLLGIEEEWEFVEDEPPHFVDEPEMEEWEPDVGSMPPPDLYGYGAPTVADEPVYRGKEAPQDAPREPISDKKGRWVKRPKK
jgi:hypothetical protein